MLRIQLINRVIGSRVLELADPIDINSLTQTIKRSSEFGGIMYEMILDLEFIKDGRDFVKRAYEEDAGIDTVTIVNLYEYNPNSRPHWVLGFTGQINYNRYELTETTVTVNIEQTGVQRRVLNMMEIDVDLETTESEDGSSLPPQNTQDVLYHSKKILLQFKAEIPDEEQEFYLDTVDGADTWWFQFPFTATYDEIEVRQDYPMGPSEFSPMEVFKYNWRIQVGGEYKIKIPKLAMYFQKVGGNATNWFVAVELVYGRPNNYTTVQLYNSGEIVITGPIIIDQDNFELDVTLEPGDEIFFFVRFFCNIDINLLVRPFIFDGPAIIKTTFEIDAETLFPESIAKTILIHEAFERCLQYITNQVVVFKSTILGRTDIGYDEDGEFALIGITNGNRLRRKNANLPAGQRGDNIFTSLDFLLKFVNTLACVDFGFEVDEENRTIFVLEKKEYFFDKTTRILSLGQVRDIKKRLIPKRFYNKFEIGYNEKIDVDQINSIDEFNTIRRYTIPVINTKNQLIVTTDMVTAGYLIENQRRLSITTEDGKNDDSLFAVVLVRDGEGYKTKKDEGYSEITNVLFPDTGYNYDISPARIAKNWFKVIAASLIRSNRKTIRFAFGTVNYIMTTKEDGSTVVLAENDSFDLTNIEPIWDNEDYEFERPTTLEEWNIIRSNPRGYFEFEDRFGNKFEGFISDQGIEYDRTQGIATFNLMRTYRP